MPQVTIESPILNSAFDAPTPSFRFDNEGITTARLTKSILARGEQDPFRETPDQMARCVCRDLGGKRNVVVINHEAHHCYWRKADAEEEALSADERADAKQRDEDAHVWSSRLLAIQQKIGIKAVYDPSATPFFLSRWTRWTAT